MSKNHLTNRHTGYIMYTLDAFYYMYCNILLMEEETMKNKSVLAQIIMLVLLVFVCISVTVLIALLAGSVQTDLIDFASLNFSNVVPVLIIGLSISGLIILVAVLIASRSISLKVKEFVLKNIDSKKENDNAGGNKK